MPLTRDQLQEIKSILKTSVSEIIYNDEFLNKLAEKVSNNIQNQWEIKMEEQKAYYEHKIKKLEEKIDSMEQYNRRKNIRIYGIKENGSVNIKTEVDNLFKKLTLT